MTLLAIAADNSTSVEATGTAIFVAVGVVGALVGAVLSRQWVGVIVAAVLAAAAVPVTYILIIGAACASGAICD